MKALRERRKEESLAVPLVTAQVEGHAVFVVAQVRNKNYCQHAAKTQQNKQLRFSFKARPLLCLAATR
jgi:hypothetical protein